MRCEIASGTSAFLPTSSSLSPPLSFPPFALPFPFLGWSEHGNTAGLIAARRF